jgi:serine/threonine protein kinase
VSPQAEANAQRRRRGRPSPEPILQRLGKYELQTEIGRGGFGSVYIAWDPVVERKVAIKVLTAGSDQDTLIRFRNEASSAGKLRHKNIVTIYDFGEDAGVPFIVMELLDGRDLHDILAQKTPLTLDQEAHILSQAASGLHHAHVNGLVHRDVKPSNVMVLRDFSVKILDFGIARLMQATNSRLTQEGSIVGTMSYMSPEQLRGADCDALSDIFSLGVVAYELVTRRHPFHARDPAAVMYAITSKEPEPVRALVPECPAAIEEVIMRALAKDRDLRYHSAEDMVLDIEPVLRELRQQRAAKLLSEAQTTLEAGQLETASGLAREIIDLDPGSSAARRFRDTIQQKLQRRAVKPKIEALLSESQDMLTLRHFHSALERVEHALRLDRTDQRAQALRDKVRAAREHAKRAEALLAEAHKAFEEKNLTGAYQNVSAALQSDRDNPDAAVFLEKIRQEIDQRERERALREGLAKARASMTIESFDEALTLLAVLRAQQPDSSDVQDLEVEVRRRKTDSERRDRLLRGLSSARDLLRQQQISEAIRLLEPLVSEFPNTAEAADLLSFAHQAEQAERRARKVAEIEQSVEQCLTAQDFVEAGNLIQKAAAEFPADASIARLQQRVQSVKAAADRERAIREIFAKGEEFLGAQKFSEGIRLLDDALQEHGNEATLVELRGRVELQWAVVKREQARKAVVAEARRLLDNEQAAAAISSIQQALTVHPADAELGAMLGLAQRMLADQQRAEAVARLASWTWPYLPSKTVSRGSRRSLPCLRSSHALAKRKKSSSTGGPCRRSRNPRNNS